MGQLSVLTVLLSCTGTHSGGTECSILPAHHRVSDTILLLAHGRYTTGLFFAGPYPCTQVLSITSSVSLRTKEALSYLLMLLISNIAVPFKKLNQKHNL